MSEKKVNVEGHGLNVDFKGKWVGSYHKIPRVREWKESWMSPKLLS